MRICLILIFFALSFCLSAQDQTFGSTSSTSIRPVYDPYDDKPKNKRLMSWYKKKPNNTLIGNPCMDQVTSEFGFQYVLQPKGQPGYRSELGRLIHNLGVKTALLFKNGPFWKMKLKRKRRECMAKTGDYVG